MRLRFAVTSGMPSASPCAWSRAVVARRWSSRRWRRPRWLMLRAHMLGTVPAGTDNGGGCQTRTARVLSRCGGAMPEFRDVDVYGPVPLEVLALARGVAAVAGATVWDESGVRAGLQQTPRHRAAPAPGSVASGQCPLRVSQPRKYPLSGSLSINGKASSAWVRAGPRRTGPTALPSRSPSPWARRARFSIARHDSRPAVTIDQRTRWSTSPEPPCTRNT